MYGIDHIDLVFENCECVSIDGKYIGDFCIDDIRRKVSRQAMNYIGRSQTAHDILIELHADANSEYYPFGQKFEEDKTCVFDRIQKWHDITQIEVFYDEQKRNGKYKPTGESEVFFVNWVGDSDYENKAQKSIINKFGDLLLIIRKDCTDEELFDFYDGYGAEERRWNWRFLREVNK